MTFPHLLTFYRYILFVNFTVFQSAYSLSFCYYAAHLHPYRTLAIAFR